MSRALLVALASLAAVASVPADQDAPVFAVGLDLVNVTVTVRGRDGNLVSDLPAEDFVVTGNSGGGTMTTWLCGVEPRWTMGAPSCFVTTLRRNAENAREASALSTT